jgi:hypothetical protein
MLQQAPVRQSHKRRRLPAETSLIAMCCVCGLVRARKTSAADSDRWVTKRAYEQMYAVTLIGNSITHTYCSGCYMDFLQRVSPVQRL